MHMDLHILGSGAGLGIDICYTSSIDDVWGKCIEISDFVWVPFGVCMRQCHGSREYSRHQKLGVKGLCDTGVETTIRLCSSIPSWALSDLPSLTG